MSGGNYNFSVDIFMLTGGEESTTVETPTFEPEAGTYISSANVRIKSKTGGANIYYTTDGSEPTETKQLLSRLSLRRTVSTARLLKLHIP